MPSQDALYGDELRGPNDFYLLGSARGAVNVTIGERSAIGPTMNLVLATEEDGDVALRGLALGKTLVASIHGAELEGLWGSEPIRLRVTRHEKRLHVEGLLRGRITDLWVGPETVTGTSGPCGYDLARRGPVYEGTARCGSGMELLSLQVPESLTSFGQVGSMALLAVLLTG